MWASNRGRIDCSLMLVLAGVDARINVTAPDHSRRDSSHRQAQGDECVQVVSKDVSCTLWPATHSLRKAEAEFGAAEGRERSRRCLQ